MSFRDAELSEDAGVLHGPAMMLIEIGVMETNSLDWLAGGMNIILVADSLCPLKILWCD